MDKEKISKALCIIAIVILVFAGLSRLMSANSMTLAEYATQKEAAALDQ